MEMQQNSPKKAKIDNENGLMTAGFAHSKLNPNIESKLISPIRKRNIEYSHTKWRNMIRKAILLKNHNNLFFCKEKTKKIKSFIQNRKRFYFNLWLIRLIKTENRRNHVFRYKSLANFLTFNEFRNIFKKEKPEWILMLYFFNAWKKYVMMFPNKRKLWIKLAQKNLLKFKINQLQQNYNTYCIRKHWISYVSLLILSYKRLNFKVEIVRMNSKTIFQRLIKMYYYKNIYNDLIKEKKKLMERFNWNHLVFGYITLNLKRINHKFKYHQEWMLFIRSIKKRKFIEERIKLNYQKTKFHNKKILKMCLKKWKLSITMKENLHLLTKSLFDDTFHSLIICCANKNARIIQNIFRMKQTQKKKTTFFLKYTFYLWLNSSKIQNCQKDMLDMKNLYPKMILRQKTNKFIDFNSNLFDFIKEKQNIVNNKEIDLLFNTFYCSYSIRKTQQMKRINKASSTFKQNIKVNWYFLKDNFLYNYSSINSFVPLFHSKEVTKENRFNYIQNKKHFDLRFDLLSPLKSLAVNKDMLMINNFNQNQIQESFPNDYVTNNSDYLFIFHYKMSDKILSSSLNNRAISVLFNIHRNEARDFFPNIRSDFFYEVEDVIFKYDFFPFQYFSIEKMNSYNFEEIRKAQIKLRNYGVNNVRFFKDTYELFTKVPEKKITLKVQTKISELCYNIQEPKKQSIDNFRLAKSIINQVSIRAVQNKCHFEYATFDMPPIVFLKNYKYNKYK